MLGFSMGVQMEDKIQAGSWADRSQALVMVVGGVFFLSFPFFGGGDGVDIPAEASEVQGGILGMFPRNTNSQRRLLYQHSRHSQFSQRASPSWFRRRATPKQ